MAKLNFNAANEEGMDDYSVVPADTYNAQVVKSEVADTKAKTGKLLKLQFKIIDGKFKGRIVFLNTILQILILKLLKSLKSK